MLLDDRTRLIKRSLFLPIIFAYAFGYSFWLPISLAYFHQKNTLKKFSLAFLFL